MRSFANSLNFCQFNPCSTRRTSYIVRGAQTVLLLLIAWVLLDLYVTQSSCSHNVNFLQQAQSDQEDRRLVIRLKRPDAPSADGIDDKHSHHLGALQQKLPKSLHHLGGNAAAVQGDGGVAGDKLFMEMKQRALKRIHNSEARRIVDAVLEAGRQPISLSDFRPTCKGNLKEYEVEDILCIRRPTFLKAVKNPCWWQPLDERGGAKSELHCLPYFHILGCGKCGTSDLWNKITAHPDTVKIHGTVGKEANWWAWRRYGLYANRTATLSNFSSYTSYNFQRLIARVEESLLTLGSDHTRLISGDGTPSDLFDHRGWRNISQNRGLETPAVLTPHLMKHFYPNPKFIAIFRNPVERLYSDYFFASHGKDAAGFHEAVLRAIHVIASCLEDNTIRQCLFDRNVYAALPTRLHFLFYSIYIREWLQVFPRENFLFLKFEDFRDYPKRTLQKTFQFITLSPLNQTMLNSLLSMEVARVGKKKLKADAMLPKTRQLLEAMTAPCNRQFAQIMKDDRFAWDD